MEELIISLLKTQVLTPRNQVVLGCTLKYTTSAVSVWRAKVAAALALASVTAFLRRD